LRETLDLVKEGRELVEYCAAELEAVGRGLEELKLEELVARLEAGAREETG
jgi:exodeoxyribonuclease VII small subunit